MSGLGTLLRPARRRMTVLEVLSVDTDIAWRLDVTWYLVRMVPVPADTIYAWLRVARQRGNKELERGILEMPC